LSWAAQRRKSAPQALTPALIAKMVRRRSGLLAGKAGEMRRIGEYQAGVIGPADIP
jgi:hypothetical protein